MKNLKINKQTHKKHKFKTTFTLNFPTKQKQVQYWEPFAVNKSLVKSEKKKAKEKKKPKRI